MPFTWNRNENELVTLAGIGAPLAAAPSPQRARIADLLVGYYEFLARNGPQHPQLGGAIQAMQSAVAAYRSNSAADPIEPLRAVNAAITAARAADPTIPEP